MHINLVTILIVVAILYLVGGGYGGWYADRYRPYGYGGGGLLVVILILLVLSGRL